jgi:hypothetical protein
MMSEREWQIYESMKRACSLALRYRQCVHLYLETRDLAVRGCGEILAGRLDSALSDLVAFKLFEPNLFEESRSCPNPGDRKQSDV